MSNTELLMRLRQLHEELSAINLGQEKTELVDEETVDALGDLVSDASQLIDKVKASELEEFEPLGEEHSLLTERLLEFDQQHPRVREFLTQMTDLLAMMGI